MAEQLTQRRQHKQWLIAGVIVFGLWLWFGGDDDEPEEVSTPPEVVTLTAPSPTEQQWAAQKLFADTLAADPAANGYAAVQKSLGGEATQLQANEMIMAVHRYQGDLKRVVESRLPPAMADYVEVERVAQTPIARSTAFLRIRVAYCPPEGTATKDDAAELRHLLFSRLAEVTALFPAEVDAARAKMGYRGSSCMEGGYAGYDGEWTRTGGQRVVSPG